MEIIQIAFAVFVIGTAIVMGVFMLVFSHSFSVGMYRFRKAVWRWDFTDLDVRIGQIATLIVGFGLLVIGVIVAVQLIFS